MTRCKFKCISITQREVTIWINDKPSWRLVNDAEFSAVTTGPENAEFFQSTPNGKLNVATVKPAVFEIGKCYFLDITKAD